MNRRARISLWSSAILAALFAAGCAGGSGGPAAPLGGGSSPPGSGGPSGGGSSAPFAGGPGPLVVFTSWATGEIGLVDLTLGALVPVPNLNRPGEDLRPLAMSADGRFLLADGWGTVLYDRRAAQRVSLPGMAGFGVDMTPDARWILTENWAAGGGFGIGLYDRTQQVMVPLPGIGTDGRVARMDASAERIAYIEDATGAAQVYDRPSRSVIFDSLAELGLEGDVADITADGSYVCFLTAGLDDIVLYDLFARVRVPLPGISFPPPMSHDLDALSPDGRYIVARGYGSGGPFSGTSEVGLYTVQGRAYLPLPGIGAVTDVNLLGRGPVAVSADGYYLAGWWADAGGASGRLRVYDRARGRLVPLPAAVDASNAVMPLLWP